MLGTFAYIPPEQARGELDHIDKRSDVFGLGAILCTILTGHPPSRSGRSRPALRGCVAPRRPAWPSRAAIRVW